MRVLMDTTFGGRGRTGTGIYLERLVPELEALGVEVVGAFNERRRPPAGGGLGSLRNAASDRLWAELDIPRRARAAGADLVHHPLPAHSIAASCPQVITVHDLAFERLPECFDPRFRAFARRAYRAAARRSDAVICVSQTTAEDVRSYWRLSGERIVVAPHGPGQELPDVAPQEARHFLYVGDAEPRKNVPLLLEGYAAYREQAGRPLQLVLAGSAEAGAPGVRVEPFPDAARLAELLAGARALVHPALYEGFGLTPLEAMGAGVPVLAASAPGLTEVCGDAALYFDPHDAQALAQSLERLAGDDALCADLVRRGRERVAEFSWERSAREHLRAYTLALGE